MANPKKYYWLKLKKDFFNQKEIKKLRKIAGGDTYTIIYLKMQLLTLQDEGILKFEGTEENLAEQLSLEIDEDVDNIQVTINFLIKNKLLEEIQEDEYLLPKTVECIGKEGKSAERVRKFREKKKNGEQKALQCNTIVTKCNTETETETEIETEIETEQQIEKIVGCNKAESKIILSVCKKSNCKNVVAVVKEKLEIIDNGNFNNRIGALIRAIENNWTRSKNSSSVSNFNNFEPRQYDYEDLEKKLLGWDNDDEENKNAS